LVNIIESVVDKDEIITESFFGAIKVSCNFGNSLFIEYLCERLFTMNEKVIYNED
jgi:hypothetical protein